jgi:hypothetical protein
MQSPSLAAESNNTESDQRHNPSGRFGDRRCDERGVEIGGGPKADPGSPIEATGVGGGRSSGVGGSIGAAGKSVGVVGKAVGGVEESVAATGGSMGAAGGFIAIFTQGAEVSSH